MNRLRAGYCKMINPYGAARLREQFGASVVVWRYYPVVFSVETPADFNVENF